MSSNKEITLPSSLILQYAAKIAIEEDKPILLDYWIDSLNKKAFIGQKKESKEKLLVKSAEEFTSIVSKIYTPKGSDEFIIVTENSIYIVSNTIERRVVS
jgi:hypothetical protein